jgi:hypothetical protein
MTFERSFGSGGSQRTLTICLTHYGRNVILVGTSASGLLDLRATPVDAAVRRNASKKRIA